MKITEYSVKRRLATGAITLAIVMLGILGLMEMPVNYLPDVTYPLIKIQIRWPGATPEEIIKDIADPLERIIATVDNLDSLESTSREGLYALDVNFTYGADIDIAFQDVLAALTRAEQQLPKDIETPFVFKSDPSQLPVMQLTVSSDSMSPVELREWSDSWLQDQILAVQGVAGTEIFGGLKREIRVHLDPLAMEKHQLPLQTVMQRLSEANIEQTGGRVTVGKQEIIARTVGEFKNLEQIASVVVSRNGPNKLYLRDIAEVIDSHEDPRVITRINGESCVKLSVLKESKANTVEVARAVDVKLVELQPNLPIGLKLGYVENQADYVDGALAGVRNSLIQAIVLLIIVVYLFLGSLRQVAVMVVALPLTMIVNFAVMRIFGFSMNIFSLGGLVVAIGIILDNSIVVIENITRIRNENPNLPLTGLAIDSVSEVGPAIIAATAAFMALFLPLLLVPGLTSLLFRELILIFASIVIISLIVAIAITPMMATLFFAKNESEKKNTKFEIFFERFTEKYGNLLGRALKAKWKVIILFIVLLGFSILLFGRVGSEFLPLVDDGRIMIKVKLPAGTSLYETDNVIQQVENLIIDDPVIDSAFALAGGQVRGFNIFETANEGQIDIQLVPKSKRNISTQAYVAKLRPIVSKIQVPSGQIMVSQMPIKGIKNLRSSDIIVELQGQDIDVLANLAQKTVGLMNGLEMFQNVSISMDISKPEFQVTIDRMKAAELDISVSDVAGTLRTLITGSVVSRYRQEGEYYDIRVLIPNDRLVSRRSIEDIVVTRAQGRIIRVSEVASVIEDTGPLEIIRKNQIKQITVQANTSGVDVGTARAKIQEALNQMDRPAGYEFSLSGQAELVSDMMSGIVSAMLFAFFFAFVVLAVQFNSIRFPTLILICAPFSLAGLIFGLILSGLVFSATVLIGVLVVIALTINDGVLLLTTADEIRQKENLNFNDAVHKAAKIRLRPRLMTTFTTIIGFTPLAINLGEGADMLQPMAVGAIGGLIMEAFVALFLMPCIFALSERKTHTN